MIFFITQGSLECHKACKAKSYRSVITDRQLEQRRNPIMLKDLAGIVSTQVAGIGLARSVFINAVHSYTAWWSLEGSRTAK